MNYLENLNKAISNSGLKKNYIAKVLNIKYDTLRRKLNGEQEFKISELQTLTTILNIKLMEVFENEKN